MSRTHEEQVCKDWDTLRSYATFGADQPYYRPKDPYDQIGEMFLRGIDRFTSDSDKAIKAYFTPDKINEVVDQARKYSLSYDVSFGFTRYTT